MLLAFAKAGNAVSKFDDATVSRVADAVQAAAIAQARIRIEKHEFPIERIESTFGVAQSEADRSASILLFALVEDLMLECLKTHLNPQAYGGWEGVTGGNGLLATASDRISLLELLYWIRPSTGADLRLMKSIRNRFAHHADVHSYRDGKVSGWVSSMNQHEKPALREIYYYKNNKLTVRNLYLIRAVGTIFRLISDLAIGPVAIQESLDPSQLLGKDFSEQPQNVQDATRAQARLMLQVALAQADQT
jgi:hypothetical protein